MSFYLITASAAATLGSDDPVIPASEVGAVRSAAEVVHRAGRLHDAVAGQVAAAAETAAARGYAEGHAAGVAAAASEARTQMFTLTLQLAEERARLRGDVTRLALEVVRRIAGGIGEAATVAALAEHATAGFLPDEIATVRVPPAAVAATRQRLQRFAGLSVVGDPGVAANDCLIETPLGVSHAGLDIQLAAVERAWAAAVEPAEERVDAG